MENMKDFEKNLKKNTKRIRIEYEYDKTRI